MRDIVYLSLGDTVLELLDFEDPEERAPEGPRVGYRMMALEVESMSEALAYLGENGIPPIARALRGGRRVPARRDQRPRRSSHRAPAVVNGSVP